MQVAFLQSSATSTHVEPFSLHLNARWQGWARDVKARDRDETFVALETLKYKFY